MSAVLKLKPVWQTIREEFDWEVRQGRPPDAEQLAYVEPDVAERYLVEQGESLTDALVQTLAEAIEDDRKHARMNNVIGYLMRTGDDMPLGKAKELAETLQSLMTDCVRVRLKRRVERELMA